MQNKNDIAHSVFCAEPGSYGIEKGLSKREYAAIHIVAALLSKYDLNTPEDQQTVSQLSVELTDTLFNHLDK